MASNKFFPWNKTDKRQLDSSRSGVVVPIPIECISIKGLDCEIAPKVRRTLLEEMCHRCDR
jgi:hypothetical protein